MKPFQTFVATILCQSILLSPTAMAKKEASGETRKDKQEARQAADKKQSKPETKKAAEKKSSPQQSKPQTGKQSKPQTGKKQGKNQPAKKSGPDKQRELPKQATKTNDKPAKKNVAVKKNGGKKDSAAKSASQPGKRPNADKKDDSGRKDVAAKKGGGKKDNADKRMNLPGKRPDAGKKDVPGKKDFAEKKGGGKKDNTDKRTDLPAKRQNAGKMDEPKKKTADRKADGKGKTAAKKQDSKQSSNKSAKRAKRMDLPGKRPQVADAERTARAERLQKQANQRRAENRRAEARPDRKARDRREKVVKAGQNSRKIRRPDVRNNTQNNWWNTHNNRVTNNRVTNNDVRIRNTRINTTTVINRNFERNVNWTTRRQDWGYNPWWNRPQTRPWYGSSWNGRWNRNYYRTNYHSGYHHGYNDGYRPPGYSTTSVGAAIGWGLIGWSLGSMVYNSGYQTYQNPYPVSRPVSYGNTQVNYTQPITRVAVETAPENSEAIVESTARSESIIAESQDAFRQRNYLVALELADKAIAESPGDGALHEYRALVLFALGKYGDAAGVLNPVLASGPGWDWSTMIALYDSQQTYTDQLQRLETYSEAHPNSADTHFLLGYHYMVCGHTDLATPQFDLAAKLMPSDSVSRQLAELTSASADANDDDANEAEVPTPEEAEELPEPEPVPLEQLTGTWTSTRDDGSTVTLVFGDDGKFTWSYVHDGKTNAFAGDYSMNDDGLLVLDSEDSQMVATVELPQEQEMNFVLSGGPPEDPGLDFKKG